LGVLHIEPVFGFCIYLLEEFEHFPPSSRNLFFLQLFCCTTSTIQDYPLFLIINHWIKTTPYWSAAVDLAALVFLVKENTMFLQISQYGIALFVKLNKKILAVAFPF